MNRQSVPEGENLASKGQIELRLWLRDDSDIAAAYRAVRNLARGKGMPASSTEELVTAVSEVARNVIEHAREGELLAGVFQGSRGSAILVIAEDRGPGIANVSAAMAEGFSTGPGLGLGLSSAREFVDAFEIRSAVDGGTTVTLAKWIERQR